MQILQKKLSTNNFAAKRSESNSNVIKSLCQKKEKKNAQKNESSHRKKCNLKLESHIIYKFGGYVTVSMCGSWSRPKEK